MASASVYRTSVYVKWWQNDISYQSNADIHVPYYSIYSIWYIYTIICAKRPQNSSTRPTICPPTLSPATQSATDFMCECMWCICARYALQNVCSIVWGKLFAAKRRQRRRRRRPAMIWWQIWFGNAAFGSTERDRAREKSQNWFGAEWGAAYCCWTWNSWGDDGLSALYSAATIAINNLKRFPTKPTNARGCRSDPLRHIRRMAVFYRTQTYIVYILATVPQRLMRTHSRLHVESWHELVCGCVHVLCGKRSERFSLSTIDNGVNIAYVTNNLQPASTLYLTPRAFARLPISVFALARFGKPAQ